MSILARVILAFRTGIVVNDVNVTALELHPLTMALRVTNQKTCSLVTAAMALNVVPPSMQTIIHVSSPDPRDQQHAMVNTLNLLDDETVTSPDDDVAMVANGAGVRMFVEVTASNRDMVDELRERGVELLACRNALRGMGATDDDLLPGVEGVPSGPGALTRLQDNGYGYIKAP